MARLIPLLLGGVLLWGMACAEEVTLADVFAGKVVPTTITCKAVTAEWQRFTLGGANSAMTVADLLGLMRRYEESPAMTALQNCNYYSKGDTITVAGQTYLVAYRFQWPLQSQLYNVMLLGENNENAADTTPKSLLITEETPLRLCLLNTKDAGYFLDIHPADIQQELTIANKALEQARKQQQQTVSMNNVRHIATALMMYAQNNEESFPKFASATDFKPLLPYLGNEKMTRQPGSNEPYRFNLALSGKSIGVVKDPTTVPSVYEIIPDADGRRVMGFVDGHAALIAPEEWAQYQKKWKLEEAPAAVPTVETPAVPPVPTAEVAPPPPPPPPAAPTPEQLQAQSVNNVRQLALAVLMHVQDNSGFFPKFTSAVDYSRLKVYLGSLDMVRQPGTEKDYRINLALSGKQEKMIKDPATIPVVYEVVPGPDGSRVMSFADGHAEIVPASRWPYLQRKWKLEGAPLVPVEVIAVPVEEKE